MNSKKKTPWQKYCHGVGCFLRLKGVLPGQLEVYREDEH